MDEARRIAIAARCECLIVRYAGARGFTQTELGARYPVMRELNPEDRFRVCILLCKSPQVSVTTTRLGDGFKFYPRSLAPLGAFNYNRRTPGQVIDEAGRK